MTSDFRPFSLQLAHECGQAGLTAEVLGHDRVHVSAPGADRRFAETVRCALDQDGRLTWHWSWGEPICGGSEIGEAVRRIARVVAPEVQGEKHSAVAEIIRGRIESGELPPERRIPSQSEMADELGVPERTVAHAVAELRDRGYLWTVPHKGSYVRPERDWRSSEAADARGGQPDLDLGAAQGRAVDADVAAGGLGHAAGDVQAQAG
jgi:hypothetical protein